MPSSDTTIAAISTAAGTGARAIVRVSGPAAMTVASAVFSPPLHDVGGFRFVEGRLSLRRTGAAAIELPARAYVFRAPRSYTREDLIELHVPGTPLVASALLGAMLQAGASLAQAGEFTLRAFLSGRLGLSQAQAVADVIDAADDAALRSAVSALRGRVGRIAAQTMAELTDVLALVEASIDLAEEQIELESPQRVADRLRHFADRLGHVADSAGTADESGRCPHVVLAGAPNAGKSSLLNALCGTDRAIVSALAGTTRDVLTVQATLGAGQTVTLQDAAGFVPQAEAQTLAGLANQAARAAVASADLVLLLVDAANPSLALLEEIRQINRRCPLLVVANKIDLLPADAQARVLGDLEARSRCTPTDVSALTGQGLSQLKLQVASMLNLQAHRPGEAMALHERQKHAMRQAADAARSASAMLAEAAELADVAELVAVDLRMGLAQLATLDPAPSDLPEEVLTRIFARFCVGK